MRDIKFRAKRSDNGKWVYGFWYKGHRFDDAVKEVPLGDCRLFDCIITPDGIIFDVDPKTVGEYTDKKDMDDKEIYEGDICKDTLDCIAKNHKHIVTVEFRDSAFCFKEIPNPIFLEVWHESIKVIGNIYENSELLEDTNDKK